MTIEREANRPAFPFPFPNAFQFPFPMANPASMQPFMQPFWALTEQGIARTEPVAKSVVSTQIAAMSFAGSRARAQLDLAAKLGACRTPQAVMATTTAFWADAAQQYMGFAQQCAGAWQGAYASSLAAIPAGPVRDMLTVPDQAATKTDEPVRQPAGANRRAA